MRANNVVISARITDKNRVYMSRLGLMDNRNGRTKTKQGVMSRFINECITIICENGMHEMTRTRGGIAGPDELRTAYIKFLVANKNIEIEKLKKEIVTLASNIPSEQEYHATIKELQSKMQ